MGSLQMLKKQHKRQESDKKHKLFYTVILRQQMQILFSIIQHYCDCFVIVFIYMYKYILYLLFLYLLSLF